MSNSSNPAYYEFSEQQLARMDPNNYPGLFDPTIYESDEFRMYGFKIKLCPRIQRHDWTDCPFAHRGEKARRRDPRKYNYAAVPCPDLCNGECRRGDTCCFAHGVFENWLHPDKYRTRACNHGQLCNRKVCFFAHNEQELRGENKNRYYAAYQMQTQPSGGGGGGEPLTQAQALPVALTSTAATSCTNFDFLDSLSGLKRPWGGGEMVRSILGSDHEPDSSNDPDIKWVTELVEL